jgi:AcrR family transcriptional regulator
VDPPEIAPPEDEPPVLPETLPKPPPTDPRLPEELWLVWLFGTDSPAPPPPTAAGVTAVTGIVDPHAVATSSATATAAQADLTANSLRRDRRGRFPAGASSWGASRLSITTRSRVGGMIMIIMISRGAGTQTITSTQPRPPEIRTARKARTRERLIEAAAEVIARDGFQAASLMEIARRAGVTTGAVYSSFRNKEELLHAAVKESAPNLVGDSFQFGADGAITVSSAVELAVAIAGHCDEPVARRLLQLQMEILSLALREPRIREAFVREIRAASESIADLVKRQVESEKDPPAQRTPTLEEATTAILSAIQGLTIRRILEPGSIPDDVFAWTADALVRALPAV